MPVQVRGLDDVIAVAPHRSATCVVRRGGEIACWGDVNGFARVDKSPVPVEVHGPSTMVALELGFAHACGLTRDGTVLCWGMNVGNALGEDSGHVGGRSKPGPVPGLDDVVQISTNYQSNCALERTGAVLCWGSRSRNQGKRPEPVPGLVDVVEVRLGVGFGCARHGDGTVSCWSRYRPLPHGPGTRAQRFITTPVRVPGIVDAVELDADSHVCVRRATGGVLCWGDNDYGQLGDGTTMPRSAPTAVPGIEDAVEVTLDPYNTCVRRANDRVLCWGDPLSPL